MTAAERDVAEQAESIARALRTIDRTVAVAESLTGGQLASALSRVPDASTWFLGGVVAYTLETKVRALGVTPGPVVTAQCASEMADGVRRLLNADISVAVTGVGGPSPDEGHPPGTVYLAVSTVDGTDVRLAHFSGSPADVVRHTVDAAIDLLATALPTVTD